MLWIIFPALGAIFALYLAADTAEALYVRRRYASTLAMFDRNPQAISYWLRQESRISLRGGPGWVGPVSIGRQELYVRRRSISAVMRDLDQFARAIH